MTVAFRAVSAWHDGATGLTADKVLAIPAAQVTGDLILILAAWKDYAITAQVSGYTEITEYADGTTATGNGTGSMKVGAWYKVATSDTEANPTLDFSTATGLVGEACVLVFSTSGSGWATPLFSTAAWPSQSTGTVDATSGAVALPDGGAIVLLVGISDDSATFSRTSIDINVTVSGGLFAFNGNYTEAPATHASTTTGNDMAADAGYRLITTGASKTLRGAIGALSAVETGAMLWVVLGDTSGSPVTGTGAGAGTASTSSGTAAETFIGTGGGTGTAATASGTGTSLQEFTGTGAGTQVAATASGTGVEAIDGTGAGTLPPPAGTGSGTSLLAATGTGAGAQAAAGAAGSGEVATLGDITGTGAGEQVAASATGEALQVFPGGGVQVPQSAYGEGMVEGGLEVPPGQGSSLYSPRLRLIIGGSGAGTQARQSAHGTGRVNDDDLVVMAA